MRRLIRRRKRLIALSLMLAMGGFIVNLAGCKSIEPTVQGRKQTPAASINIESTSAEPVATVEVHENSADPGKVVSDAPGVDTTWRSSYDKSVSALANFASGGTATASGRLKASVEVSEDHLQYKSSINGGEMVTFNGCADCAGGGTFSSTSIIQFSITKRLQFSFSGSLSATGGFARVAFTGNGVDEIRQNTDKKVMGFFKTGNLEPGLYTIKLDARSKSTGVSNGVISDVSVTVGPIPPPNEFHWINPAGGDFGTASNWNPAGVPGASDTVIFDLPGTKPVTVTAQNVSVARLLNHGMDLELHGSLQVLTRTPFPQLGFTVDQGGQLLLNNGATLATEDGIVSGSVFVSGAGTKWTIGTSGELDIGFLGGAGEVVVVNDGSLNAQKSIKVGDVNAVAASSLRVESGGLMQTPSCTIEKGNVLVTGQGLNDSKLQISNLNVGGQMGPGSMLLENGGTVNAHFVHVGDAAGNPGDTITISGVDKGGLPSTLFVSGGTPLSTFNVFGGAGTQVEVKDGGFLATDAISAIGDKASVGKVFVHGKAGTTPASWDIFNLTFIGGQFVPSELVVKDGGRVRTFTNELDVGTLANDLGRVEVTGADSFLTVDTLQIGGAGHGELDIEDGGFVQSVTGKVGQGGTAPSAGSGLVTIGTTSVLNDSEWHVTGNCFVGTDEPGKIVLAGIPFLFSVRGATLRVDGTLTLARQGLIGGNGTLAAANRVPNGGFISPGLSPGLITIEGDYQQTADGVLRMEAAGLNDGQFDVLHVTGSTSLGGMLEVRFLNGYLPKTSDVMPFLKLDGAVTGSFGQIIFPQLAPGFQFNTEMVNGSFKLTALNNAVLAATPTPTPTPTPSPTPTPTQSPNVVQFSSSNYGVIEACTTVTITVNRIGDTSGAASVEYFTADVTATERRDYITANGKLSFAAGETSKSFAVLINDDSYVEGPETFSVNLRNPSGASLGAPAIATVQITDNPSEPATNVIDDPQNFVCQHYHDFLNRQADASGLAFWTNEITSCGTNQQCIDAKRINVSAAYFLSLEFQQTGYLVERMYKTAYGDANGSSTFGGTHQLAVPIVRFNEFLTDTQRIGLGVIVGQTGWEQQLENNKQAFASEYVLRSRFITAYPTSMTPTQFVDKLNQNAGNVLSSSDRAAAIGLFGGAVNTSNSTARALALRQVAENQNLSSAEFNRAFVLMQFFGYLRRNPNDLPDSDYTGYDFWLTKLNQFNGNFVNAEMVKAFITSVEYRSRFGP